MTSSAETGPGHLRLTVLPAPFAWGWGRLKPWALVDGEPVGVAVGENLVPLDAGRHHVEVHQLLIQKYAVASTEVEVRPGEEVGLFYTPPLHWTSPGRLGTRPQQRSDWWLPYAVVGFLVLGVAVALLR